jgi:transposase
VDMQIAVKRAVKKQLHTRRKIRQLRDLSRYSTKLTQQLAAEKNRIQKILEDANIKLSSVVSDTSGVVVTKLIDGLIAGKKDLIQL